MRLRVVDTKTENHMARVVLAPVLTQVAAHKHGMPKDKSGADTHPPVHGKHGLGKDHRIVVEFALAVPGEKDGMVLDYVEQQQQVGADEIIRIVPVEHYKEGKIPTVEAQPDVVAKVDAIQLGCEYDVSEPIGADSTFVPVVHG